ncbi:hypothetical protein LTR87_016627 [Friedmanniomyces endolithicus]|nr:hypothetical protein LTR87_016627 [Friedmanniomyces endolithicus]
MDRKRGIALVDTPGDGEIPTKRQRVDEHRAEHFGTRASNEGRFVPLESDSSQFSPLDHRGRKVFSSDFYELDSDSSAPPTHGEPTVDTAAESECEDFLNDIVNGDVTPVRYVSLGGHATWQLLLTEPRIRAGLVIIGCPDYVRLMTDRAIRSKLGTCMATDPPGLRFLGSEDFPPPLLAAVEERDPAGILLGELDTVTGDDHLHDPSLSEKHRLRSILAQRLGGKKILCLSGGKDRLVPPECGEPFLTWLKKAMEPQTGWAGDLGIEVEDIVDPGARHEFLKRMRTKAERWLCDVLSSEDEVGRGRESKL